MGRKKKKKQSNRQQTPASNDSKSMVGVEVKSQTSPNDQSNSKVTTDWWQTLRLKMHSNNVNKFLTMDGRQTETHTLLHRAANEADVAWCRDLLRLGADVNKEALDSKSTPSNVINSPGETPLGMCLAGAQSIDDEGVGRRFVNTVKLLLSVGADPTIPFGKTGNDTPLHMALMINNFKLRAEIAELLLQYGADPNALNDLGQSCHDFLKKAIHKKMFAKVIKKYRQGNKLIQLPPPKQCQCLSGQLYSTCHGAPNIKGLSIALDLPCPCGSERLYLHCCGAPDKEDKKRIDDADETSSQQKTPKRQFLMTPDFQVVELRSNGEIAVACTTTSQEISASSASSASSTSSESKSPFELPSGLGGVATGDLSKLVKENYADATPEQQLAMLSKIQEMNKKLAMLKAMSNRDPTQLRKMIGSSSSSSSSSSSALSDRGPPGMDGASLHAFMERMDAHPAFQFCAKATGFLWNPVLIDRLSDAEGDRRVDQWNKALDKYCATNTSQDEASIRSKFTASAFRACSSPGCGVQETSRKQFKQCAKCQAVRYCSRECQVAHWKGSHKKACKSAFTGRYGSMQDMVGLMKNGW